MPLSDDERYLAENCYGYGRWSAKYWFIGWEQGMGEDTIPDRAKAFRELDSDEDGLVDLCSFHARIEDYRWCGQRPILQSTWKYLILLLMVFLGKADPDDDKLRRKYQSGHWGNSTGETCVIDLSGIPSASKYLTKARERLLSPKEITLLNEIRQKRLNRIHEEMTEHSPKFVIIYDLDQKSHWLQFWKDNSIDVCQSDGIWTVMSTKIVFTRAPAQSANSLWIGLGNQLRQQA
jgi:ribosome modulation factor